MEPSTSHTFKNNMNMKANKTISIFDLVDLNKPTATIGSVTYNWLNDTVSIEIIIREDGSNYAHSRNIIKPTNGEELSTVDVLAIVSNELTEFE